MNETEQDRGLQDEAAVVRRRLREAAERIAKLKAELNGIRTVYPLPDSVPSELLGARELS